LHHDQQIPESINGDKLHLDRYEISTFDIRF
jgi:hypothetical protein